MKLSGFLFIFTIAVLSSCNSGSGNKNTGDKTSSGESFHLEKKWTSDTVFRTPESVLYDSTRSICYVSNMNRGAEDGHGFISKMSLEGKIVELKWIEGLKAPKGMALSGKSLYVADVDELVEIDPDNGIISKKYKAPGASMLNDVAADRSGNVYVSDSDTATIYRFNNGTIRKWLTGGPGHPNGLYVDKDRLLVAAGASSELQSVDTATHETRVLTRGINHGDGITPAGEGRWLVSDWSGEVYMVYPDNHKVSLLKTRDQNINSADITYIADRNLLLVPTFSGNNVTAYKLVKE